MENNQLPNFNHFDFIWGIQAARLVYKPIVDIITEDESTIRLIVDEGALQKFIRRF